MKIFSQIISWLFLPLFMPVYALLLVMFVPSNQDFFFNEDCFYTMILQNKIVILSRFILFCVITPGLSYLLLVRYKIISSVHMETSRERNIPIIIMLVYCLLLYFMFVREGDLVSLPKFVYSLPLSGVFVTATFFFLNRWKKVSIHAGGGGILVGFILAYILLHAQYELWILAVAIVVSGMIMTARLFLGKHTMDELLIGWGTATFLTFAVNYLY